MPDVDVCELAEAVEISADAEACEIPTAESVSSDKKMWYYRYAVTKDIMSGVHRTSEDANWHTLGVHDNLKKRFRVYEHAVEFVDDNFEVITERKYRERHKQDIDENLYPEGICLSLSLHQAPYSTK